MQGMLVNINPGKLMYRGGVDDPFIGVFFHTIDKQLLTKESTSNLVAEITKFLHEKTGTDPKR